MPKRKTQGKTEFQSRVEAIIDRFAEIDGRYPDLTGIDWAWEHDWISREEYEQAMSLAGMLDREFGKLEKEFRKLAARHPRELRVLVRERIKSMQVLAKKLGRVAEKSPGAKKRPLSSSDAPVAADTERALRGWQGRGAGDLHGILRALSMSGRLVRQYRKLL